jgi:4-hydroxy-tetrahydrodipicolinate reductase
MTDTTVLQPLTEPSPRPRDSSTPTAGQPSVDSSGASARALRVGLVGFGRTGRDVARTVLADPAVTLDWVVRRSDRLEHQSALQVLDAEGSDAGEIHSSQHVSAAELLAASPVDVVIDFSAEDGLDYYGRAAAERGIAIVSAVSKYPESQQRRLARCAESTPVLWSPNITLGINFLLLAAQSLQRIVPLADVQITEEHFQGKKEVSGTALRLARALGVPHDGIHVTRAGGIIGVHEVLVGLPTQVVRLRHESISREAFGEGAIFAATELAGREPGLYRMEDLLEPYFATTAPGVLHGAPREGRLRGRVANGLRAMARRLDS